MLKEKHLLPVWHKIIWLVLTNSDLLWPPLVVKFVFANGSAQAIILFRLLVVVPELLGGSG